MRRGSVSVTRDFICKAYFDRRIPPKAQGAHSRYRSQPEAPSDLPLLTDTWSALVHLAHAAVLPYDLQEIIKAPAFYLEGCSEEPITDSEEDAASSESEDTMSQQGDGAQSSSEDEDSDSDLEIEGDMEQPPEEVTQEDGPGEGEEESEAETGDQSHWEQWDEDDEW